MIPVRWDSAAFTYLTTVSWDSGAPLIVVQSRDQRRMQLLNVDPKNGATTVLREEEDPRWLDVVSGVPARLADGRIAWTADADDARRLFVASEQDLMQGVAEPVTPPDLQVRSVLSVDGDTVLFSGSDAESTQIGVWAHGPEGLQRVSGERGVQGAVRGGGTTVLTSRSLAGYGASVTGRRTFDIANAWGGKDPHGVPSFIVSHSVPAEWSGARSPFTFVTDGVASAIAQAKAAAGHKDVGVAAASIAQQCLKLGLLDEIQIHLVPVLLGEGIRLFDHLGAAPIELERMRVVEAPGVTHLTFRVVK